MLSEEEYYENNLKGKTPEQLQARIRGLKRKIGHYKKQLEHRALYETDDDPANEAALTANRGYLIRAKQALIEAGGEYVPTNSETEAQQLKSDFQYISEFEFVIGGYFGGYDRYFLQPVVRDVYTVSHMPELDEIAIRDVSYQINDFYAMLDEIHLEEWKHSYYDPFICDGTQWELTVSFRNDRKKERWHGSNAFPPEFDKLEKFFGCR